MSVLSDHIENFIKELLTEDDGTTELRRNELANKFDCAPSQINYVLTTRFSPQRGYATQSRRGGGGYIRVIRLDIDRSDYIIDLIETELKKPITMREAKKIINQLYQIQFITERSKYLLQAAVSDEALKIAKESKDELRASILSEMLIRTI